MLNTIMYKRLALALTTLVLLAGTSAFTQEKGKDSSIKEATTKEAPKKDPAIKQISDEGAKGDAQDADKNQPKHRSLVRVGYTRPGTPSDKVNKNGEIIQVALDQDQTGQIIGSTVYFAVFKGTGDDNEVFGTELANLADQFVEGRSFRNTVSPNFDRKAKYLYLYQIVNDRGMNPAKDAVLPAADSDINTSDISHFALRLLVDPRYITSWGHFRNITFVANVTDRKVGKDGIVGAAEDTMILPMSFSSNPAVIKKLPHLRFQDRSPAFNLEKLKDNFTLDKSNLNLENSAAVSLMKKKAAGKEINWVAQGLEAAVEGGKEPDYVQINYGGSFEDSQAATVSRELGHIIFRADFKKMNQVKVGQHSVVFGFTSDLPPTDEPLQVQGPPLAQGPMPKMAKGEQNIQQVAFVQDPGFVQAPGEAPGVGIAPAALGTAPTPMGGGDVATAGAGTTLGSLGGSTGGVGGGGGLGFPGVGGAFGTARAPSTAGGGGLGGGQGSGDTQEQQDQDQRQRDGNINFNATLINQQAQLQAQLQFQNQFQKNVNKNGNGNDCCCGDKVIPEPGAIILGLLGLPALVYLRRRGRNETPAIS